MQIFYLSKVTHVQSFNNPKKLVYFLLNPHCQNKGACSNRRRESKEIRHNNKGAKERRFLNNNCGGR